MREILQLETIDVRRSRIEDFEAYLASKSQWADVRWSGFAAPPDAVALRRWYLEQLENPLRHMFTALVDGVAAGYVHFRQSGTAAETSQGIDLHAMRRVRRNAPRRAHGYCSEFRMEALTKLGEDVPGISRVESWVSEQNKPMEQCVLRSGFTLTELTRPHAFLLPQPHTETMRLWTFELGRRPAERHTDKVRSRER